jgi:hypothetical protein
MEGCDLGKALDRSLNILDAPLKQAVLFQLTNKFHISLNTDKINYTQKDIEKAFVAIFKSGATIMIKNFRIELENSRQDNKHL